MNVSVLLNIPNLVGYIRLLLLVIGIFQDTKLFLTLYAISSSLDFLDGYLARMFNQESVLGACLDMFTDRISTVIISLRIMKEKKQMQKFISLYVLIDLFSHFTHFYISSLDNVHHKNANNIILKVYYYKPFLCLICFFSECFFIHTLSEYKFGIIYRFTYYCTVMKMIFHIVQLIDALLKLSDYKEKAM
ncbi:phosphatidylinositol synthase [Vairimorpha ceranae]|uniref:Phosphatidylinositol synthase n=1 Tax=Vairimorpha ceranae TaxID=40302 RepID=A0A0F9WUI8_9MICR|nr:phosphatidylinositol synthase [Vairimorpha ceranae]KAF5140156.1 hypothetical protein G9O61_00g017100 [Vairimorpha ceranae]KKO76418.1 phosphatidylinositol synthase [Vairimorpha ceranae]